MALGDSLLALAEGIQPPGHGPAAGGAAGNTDISGDRLSRKEFARRVRSWYLADVAHPLWSDYIKQSEIDEGFYIGGDRQWVDNDGSNADFEMLRRQKRATISINQIKPIIKVMTGLERQTRFDYKLLPQGEEDHDDARIMTWLYKFVSTITHIPEIKSQAFKNSLIRGMSVLFCGMSWEDEVTGSIMAEWLQPGKDCIWDPHWTMPDFSDASHFLRYRWVAKKDVTAQYPEYKQEIEDAIGDLNTILSDLSMAGGSSHGPSGDSYGSVIEPNVDQLNMERYFWDPVLQRVLLIEAWYYDYETTWHIFDKETGTIEEVDDDVEDPAGYAKAAEAADPDNIMAIKRVSKYLRAGTVLPAVNVTLEEDESPYENDRTNYPYVLVLGERTGDDIRGMVRDLRDAQRVENKRISQAIDLVVRWGKIRRVAEENSLDPRSEQTINDPLAEGVLWYRTGKQPPAWDVPQGIADLTRLLVGLADQMKINIRESSGINASLLGNERDQAASGVAMARRQAQGQIIATEVFDQNRWASEIFGQRLGRRIQQKFTGEEYLRLTNDIGGSVKVLLNPTALNKYKTPEDRKNAVRDWRAAMANDPNKPEILTNVEKFKWDLVLSETPASPTARTEALEVLMSMVQKAPNLLPILMDKIVMLVDGLPDKPEIMGRIKALMVAQLGPVMGEGGPQPGGGPAVAPGMPGNMPPAPNPTESLGGGARAGGETAMTSTPPPAGGPTLA